MKTCAEMLDYILNNTDSHLMTFDYDDEDEGVGYITTQDGDFKISVSKVS